MPLAIAEIHAHEHLCPVLAFGAASSGVDLQHDAEFVFFAAQHVAEFESLDSFDSPGILAVDFIFGDEFLFVEVER